MSKCPVHSIELHYNQTQYGPRGECPRPGCTVVHWSNDKTASPADFDTRVARVQAHKVFDKLWKHGPRRRNSCYQKLANYLRLSKKETHIGRFDIEQCKAVIEFAKEL
ncbi:hypothetical protein LCGC14_2274050 [marine sediment metagenome]|uniref:Uncharacterized protein n=1 Tax=marine sediment metagenome TaxID=412755 RepID=A0A0F9FR71_9ZZZZ